MNSPPPTSIKTVGIIVSIFAGFIIFANGSGAIVHTFLGMADEFNSAEAVDVGPMDFVMSHYITMCLIMVIIGMCFLIGGINLIKHKLWANRLVTAISLLLIVLFLGMPFTMTDFMNQPGGIKILRFFPFLVGICWAAPFAGLIYYLNKKSIKLHFS